MYFFGCHFIYLSYTETETSPYDIRSYSLTGWDCRGVTEPQLRAEDDGSCDLNMPIKTSFGVLKTCGRGTPGLLCGDV